MIVSSRFSQACLLLLLAASMGQAAERPTFNVTRDPRPDILPHPFYYAHTEYRLAYNRPRCISGWIAEKIAPSSQEAMVWRENLAHGRYDEKHLPPMYKRYFGPKPWEVLATGARPDFPKQPSQASSGLDFHDTQPQPLPLPSRQSEQTP
ncbi:MAG: hypothetical protein KDA45_13560 [Planctomycetales bacterium]|nr:hypothetical protein [Planctomycetales bacterium]